MSLRRYPSLVNLQPIIVLISAFSIFVFIGILVIDLIATGRIDTIPWITHHAPMDAVPDVFPDWVKPETGVIKAIVDVVG